MGTPASAPAGATSPPAVWAGDEGVASGVAVCAAAAGGSSRTTTSGCAFVTLGREMVEVAPGVVGRGSLAVSVQAFLIRSAFAVSAAEERLRPSPAIETFEVAGRAAGTGPDPTPPRLRAALQEKSVRNSTEECKRQKHSESVKRLTRPQRETSASCTEGAGCRVGPPPA